MRAMKLNIGTIRVNLTLEIKIRSGWVRSGGHYDQAKLGASNWLYPFWRDRSLNGMAS
jgi:hypothetical protein